MDFFRCAIVKRLVQAFVVVKVQIALNTLASFSRAVVVMQVDFFVLD